MKLTLLSLVVVFFLAVLVTDGSKTKPIVDRTPVSKCAFGQPPPCGQPCFPATKCKP